MDEERLTWKNWEAEDICDHIKGICSSFGIEVDWREFEGVKTFGDVCDVICACIQLRHEDGCTSQQAFYKLRKAIVATRGIDAAAITPDVPLVDLFPYRGRRKQIKQLETAIGFRLRLLEPKHWISTLLFFGMALSFCSLFWWWRIGIFGVAASGCGIWLTFRLGKQFHFGTLGEAAKDLTGNSYVYARRELGTVNPAEIVPIIEETFRRELWLKPEELRREVEIF